MPIKLVPTSVLYYYLLFNILFQQFDEQFILVSHDVHG
jgi:hypothetical protein